MVMFPSTNNIRECHLQSGRGWREIYLTIAWLDPTTPTRPSRSDPLATLLPSTRDSCWNSTLYPLIFRYFWFCFICAVLMWADGGLLLLHGPTVWRDFQEDSFLLVFYFSPKQRKWNPPPPTGAAAAAEDADMWQEFKRKHKEKESEKGETNNKGAKSFPASASEKLCTAILVLTVPMFHLHLK